MNRFLDPPGERIALVFRVSGIVLILTLLLLTTFPLVYADSDNYDIARVYVNGMRADTNKVQVELGSTLQVAVFIEGTGTATVRAKAWIGGYEYGVIEDTTDIFNVQESVTYKKNLYLDIPDDLDAEGKDYALHIQVYDAQELEEKAYNVYIEPERHNVVVKDIILSSRTVSPGDYLAMNVRLENQGEKDEDDIRVTISVQDLDISHSVYADALLSGEQESTGTVYVLIPADARAGTYDVDVLITYNNEYTEVTGSTTFNIEGNARGYDTSALVSIEKIKSLVVGEENGLTVQVTNLGDTLKTFTVNVVAIGTSSTEDLAVAPLSTSSFTFYVVPADAGNENILVTVSSDDGLVTQEILKVTVEEAQSPYPFVVSVILAVLVLLGIVFCLRSFHT